MENNNHNSNNNLENLYGEDDNANRNEEIQEYWGPVFDTMMICFGSEPDDIITHIREASDEALGMPMVDEYKNVARLLIERILHDDSVPPEIFEVLLERYPGIVAPLPENNLDHTVSVLLSAIVWVQETMTVLPHPMYSVLTPYSVDNLIRFLEYLRTRDPSVPAGYSFVRRALRPTHRLLKRYLINNQSAFLRECVQRMRDVPDPMGLAQSEIIALYRDLALNRRKEALRAFGSTRRTRRTPSRRRKSRRQRANSRS